jgi:hypothetical protein
MTRRPKRVFLHQRRTCGNDNPFNSQVLDIFLDQRLTGIRTHVSIVTGYCHPFKSLRIPCDCFNIYASCDVGAAVAHIYSHSVGGLHVFALLLY